MERLSTGPVKNINLGSDMINKLVKIVALVVIFSAHNVHAAYEDPCVNGFLKSHADEPDVVPLDSAYFNIYKCVLGVSDKTEVSKKYHLIEHITSDQANDKNIYKKVREQVSAFMHQARTRQENSLVSVRSYDDINQLQNKLSSLIDAVSLQVEHMDYIGSSITSAITPDTSDDNWQSMGSKTPYSVSFKDIVVGNSGNNGACGDTSSEKCLVALQSMSDWLRFQKAAGGSVHEFYTNPRLFEFKKYTVFRERRWYSFFEVTNYPLPWEYAVNQKFDRFRYHIGEYGLAEPPREQLTIFRPSVAAGFANGIGQSPTPELVIEMVGYTAWDWDGPNTVNRWGVSLVGTLGEYKENNDTKTNIGIGLLLHTPTPGISLGMVARDYGKSGLIVSFDLMDLWNDRKEKVKTILSNSVDKVSQDVQ